jgi:hypothetical protein
MHPKKKKSVRKVAALVSAVPQFIALVDKGASRAPFHVVKQETTPVKIHNRSAAPVKKAASTRTVVDNQKKKDSDNEDSFSLQKAIHSLIFQKANFPDTDSVKEFMKNSDFEGYSEEIQEDGDTFVVVNDLVKDAAIVKKAVVDDDTEGVSALVVVLKQEISEQEEETDEQEKEAEQEQETVSKEETEEPKNEAEPSEESAPTEDTEEPVADFLKAFSPDMSEEEDAQTALLKKYDMSQVYWSGESDFTTLLKQGYSDGTFPGFEEVLWTFDFSVRKAFTSSDEGAAEIVRKNATDFANTIVAMHEFMSSFAKEDQTAMKESLGEESYAKILSWGKGIATEVLQKKEKPKKQDRNTRVLAKKSSEVVTEPDLKALVDEAVRSVLKEQTPAKQEPQVQVTKSITSPDATHTEGVAGGSSGSTVTDNKTVAKAAAERITRVAFGY